MLFQSPAEVGSSTWISTSGGAYTIVDDNHAGRASIPPWIDCWYQVNPGTRAADGTWTHARGPWDKFSINVVPASTGNQTGYYNQGIESDWGERSITGQVRSRVTVECPFILQVWAWSQFGHFGGNEASIRLGLNGTLSRNVTSEDYVEHHPRDIAEDGFFFSAEVHPIDL